MQSLSDEDVPAVATFIDRVNSNEGMPPMDESSDLQSLSEEEMEFDSDSGSYYWGYDSEQDLDGSESDTNHSLENSDPEGDSEQASTHNDSDNDSILNEEVDEGEAARTMAAIMQRATASWERDSEHLLLMAGVERDRARAEMDRFAALTPQEREQETERRRQARAAEIQEREAISSEVYQRRIQSIENRRTARVAARRATEPAAQQECESPETVPYNGSEQRTPEHGRVVDIQCEAEDVGCATARVVTGEARAVAEITAMRLTGADSPQIGSSNNPPPRESSILESFVQ